MEVTIRPWTRGDELELALQADNKKIFNNVLDHFPHPYTLDEAKKWIKFNSKIDPAINMAILVDGKIAGGIGGKPKEDVYRMNMEVGYFIGEEYWGRGITTIALRYFVDYLFRTFDITRVYAPVFGFNIASQRVLEKVGFRKEAVLHKSVIKNNEYHNEVIYALLKEEFTP